MRVEAAAAGGKGASKANAKGSGGKAGGSRSGGGQSAGGARSAADFVELQQLEGKLAAIGAPKLIAAHFTHFTRDIKLLEPPAVRTSQVKSSASGHEWSRVELSDE